MKKIRSSVPALSNARKIFNCCNCTDKEKSKIFYRNIQCFQCTKSNSSEVSVDLDSNASDVDSTTGKDSTTTKERKRPKLADLGRTEKVNDAVCLLRESPFRILRVAESGNVREFTRLITTDPSKLNVRDSRGRAPVHQATIRNHVAILEVIVVFHGNLSLTDNHGNTPVHLAIEFDALNALDFLLASGANTGVLNDRCLSPLHLACEHTKTDCLKIIAKYKDRFNVNQGGEHGRTALHLAAISDHEECMKILLYDIGVCPRIPCKNGFFPIHEAAKHASSQSMEILLTWGEHNGCPREEMISFFDAEGNVPLHSAVHGGDIKAVELCIKSGAKISTQQHDLSTPVHLACSQGSMEIVKLMFNLQPEEKETCLKSCDLQRMTPLHCAAMFDHCELVEYLVSQGASVNVLDKERRSPLQLAAFRNGWRTMRSLMRLGASVSIKDNDSRNILHAIVLHGGELDKILDDEICGKILQVDFFSILEEKDKHGYTPLHYAAKLGHIKTAARLLKLGASVIVKTNEGENVFHIACRFGRLNIINQILKMEVNNTVINEGDGKGLTPLHIASREGHLRVVQSLLKKGAILHRDHDGRTPLHLSSMNGHRDTMKLLLNVHSHLLDQTDKDGNTPLHVAAMEDQPEAVDQLLTMNCALTYNFKGFSAIDFALQNKFAGVALVMVVHRTRGDEVLGMTTGKYPSIMLGLVATMPQVVTAVLDRCITKSDNAKSDSEYYQIKYNFKWLSLAEPKEDEVGTSLDENAGVAEHDESFSTAERKHLPILNGMVSYGRVDLLSHELSCKYLQMKWNAYGKYIHFAQLILYILYLAILTSFASSVVVNDEVILPEENAELDFHNPNNIMGRPFFVFNKTDNNGSNSGESGSTSIRTTTLLNQLRAVVILCVAVFNLFRESSNIYRQKLKYAMDSVNWVFWAMNIACVFMVSKSVNAAADSDVNTSAAIAVFLGWFYLLLFLQRFDVVGIYVVMFLEILHTLLRVLMIFSILIVAFGLAFYILLSAGHHIAFSGIPSSLMRTFSMMLGDLDYINTFVNPYHCGHSDNQNTILPSPLPLSTSANPTPQQAGQCCDGARNLCSDRRRLPYPLASFAILGIFMVFMPILLMNLLIGLAVGDIESVRRNAQLKRLAMQVQLHTALEKTLPKFILLRVDKNEVIEYPNARKARIGMLDYFFKYFQPKSRSLDSDHRDVGDEGGDDIIMAVQENNATLHSLSNHLENIETLMRLLCHKMELNTDADYIDEGTQVEEGSLMSDIRSRFKRGVTVRLTSKKPPVPKRSDSAAM